MTITATRSSAILSEDGRYRYELVRDWSDPSRFVRRFLTFVMLNPSIADAETNDPTIHMCMKFAERLGYDGIRVVNLYAFRATDPRDLWRAQVDGVDIIGPGNNAAIRKALVAAYNTSAEVVVAWGNNATAPDRIRWLVDAAALAKTPLGCLGTTQSGAPKHPLARGLHRIPDDTAPQLWTPVGES